MTPKNILIIKPSAIGDVVHALPILNLMRKAWTGARISWLVTPACAGLLQGHPQLDEVILFDRKRYGGGWKSPSVMAEMFQFNQGLRARKFDLVVDLQGLFRSGYLAWRTGAKRRIGMAYAREGAPLFYTDRVPAQNSERHALERYLDVAEHMGLGRGPVEFVFNTTHEDRAAAAALLGESEKPFAVLLPGTNWETKKWPAERYARLAKSLRAELGLRVVVAGGPGDESLARVIQPDLSLCGQTTLPQTTALLERAALVVANDTGPMHIAAALGRPLVTLYGPTSPVRTGPYARPETVLKLDIICSPCLSRTCSHKSCLNWLEESAVLEAARRALL